MSINIERLVMSKAVKKEKNVAAVVEQDVVAKDVRDIAKEDISGLKDKSTKIRFLIAQGYSRSSIAKLLGIRYQHVRNVEVTLLKKDMKKA